MSEKYIGRYEIKGELGRGGMATVFKAYDPRFKRDVALKVLPHEFLHDPTFRMRFEREAETIATLEHPSIVPVYDYGEDNGQPFLVMRFMTGGALVERIRRGPMSPAQAAEIIRPMASALDEAHSRGIVHRDLKPANILFDHHNQPYLSDFGIVKLSESGSALTGSGVIGTPAYMSPEQAHGSGDIDARSDIYALGTILYELLTSRLPYSADTPMGVVVKHITEPLPDILATRPDLPESIDWLIRRAMAKDRNDRFATAGELASALDSIVQGEKDLDLSQNTMPMAGVVPRVPPTAASPDGLDKAAATHKHVSGPPTKVIQAGHRLSLPFILAGVAILLLILSGIFLINRGNDANIPTPSVGSSDGGLTQAPIESPGAATQATADTTMLQAQLTPTLSSYTMSVPRGAIARLGKGAINQTSLSNDGRMIAVASSTGVTLYDTQTFAELWSGPTTEPASSVAFTPDNVVLVSGSAAGTIIMWNTTTGDSTILSQQAGIITSLAVSPDQNWLAAASSGGTIGLWKVDEPDESPTILRGHTDSVLTVAFSPDSTQLASGGSDNAVIVWDVNSGEQIHKLEGHTNWIFSVAWSLDANTLASGSFDGTINQWNLETEKLVRTLHGHTGGVLDIAYSPDGTTLASGAADGVIILWDAEFGDLLRTVRGHTNWVVSIHWMPDSQQIVSGSFDSTIIAWNAGTGERLRTLRGYTDQMNAAAYSPDGPWLASGSVDGTVYLWDIVTYNIRNLLIGHTDRVLEVDFSPDGTLLASASADQTVIMWNVETGEQVFRLQGHESDVNSVVFSPNGRLIASVGCGKQGTFGRCDGGEVRLWDATTGQATGDVLSRHSDVIWSIAWSPDGTQLATSAEDGSILVWNTEQPDDPVVLNEHTSRVTGLAFSPDSHLLASASDDGMIIVWDLQTSEQRTLTGHEGPVNAVAFSPDGMQLASAGQDKRVIIWDTQTGERLQTFEGHNGSVEDVIWSAEGLLASASADGTLIVWDTIAE
jgi:WD40 repeat protein/serine/threonine protein kinase